jgi:hypothetical protein
MPKGASVTDWGCYKSDSVACVLIIMPKFIPRKLSSMLKKLGKHKSPRSQPSSWSPSLIQQQSNARTPNPTPSLAIQPLTDPSATEAASLIADNLATSVAPTSNVIPSRSETAPTSRSMAKDTAVNALKLLLKISSDIPGPGVKPALSGLLTIIERVQVRWQASDSCGH